MDNSWLGGDKAVELPWAVELRLLVPEIEDLQLLSLRYLPLYFPRCQKLLTPPPLSLICFDLLFAGDWQGEDRTLAQGWPARLSLINCCCCCREIEVKQWETGIWSTMRSQSRKMLTCPIDSELKHGGRGWREFSSCITFRIVFHFAVLPLCLVIWNSSFAQVFSGEIHQEGIGPHPSPLCLLPSAISFGLCQWWSCQL